MSPPSRIVAAVVATSLADIAPRVCWASLPAHDRACAEALLDRLRGERTGEGAALAVVAARSALERPGDEAVDARGGASLYARWLRALDAPSRARIAPRLDAQTAALVGEAALGCAPLAPELAPAAGYVVAVGARRLGRLPTAGELSSLLALASGRADLREPGIVGWERSLRVAGRQGSLVALAEAVA